MADWIEFAGEQARKDKHIKTDEEIKHDFFAVATACFNEFVAGDIELADGRIITVEEIEQEM